MNTVTSTNVRAHVNFASRDVIPPRMRRANISGVSCSRVKKKGEEMLPLFVVNFQKTTVGDGTSSGARIDLQQTILNNYGLRGAYIPAAYRRGFIAMGFVEQP